MNEQVLIEKCKANDYSAQLIVYNSYKDMMYNSSFRIVRNREDAEDIVQECFIKSFQKIHQLKEEVSLGAWLKRIVLNRSLDEVRKKKNEYWIEETHVLETESEETGPDLEIELKVSKIKKCMDELKEKYRVILNLYMIEDYNHREISELLKKNETNGIKEIHTGT